MRSGRRSPPNDGADMSNDNDDLIRKIISWAWVPCDQTIACPCCGVAWWDTEGDIKDDWHEPECEFQQILVCLGMSTGIRVAQGTKVFDRRSHDLKQIERLKRTAALNEQIAKAALELKRSNNLLKASIVTGSLMGTDVEIKQRLKTQQDCLKTLFGLVGD